MHVEDREAVFAWRRQEHDEALAGAYDHTFTLRQLAYYIQTGEWVPLLPN